MTFFSSKTHISTSGRWWIKVKRISNEAVSGIKPTIHENSAASKHGDIYYWKIFKITDHKFRFWILNVIVFLADIGY